MNARRAIVALTLVVSAVGLAGCPTFVKAKGTQFADAKAPDTKGQLYVYRPAAKIMSDFPLYTFFSDKDCFKLESGGYAQYVADPGPFKFVGTMTTRVEKSVELRAGESKYIEVTIEDDKPVLTEVAADTAKAKIAATRGVDACDIEDLKRGRL